MTGGDPAKTTVSRSVPLTSLQRLLSFLLGAAALGGGATATFITNNSAGSGVMLAVGAFFMLISITGDRPIRAQIAGNQIDFLDETLMATLDSPEPQAKATLAEHIVDQQLPVSPPVRAQAEYVLYERDVIAALGSIVGAPTSRSAAHPGTNASTSSCATEKNESGLSSRWSEAMSCSSKRSTRSSVSFSIRTGAGTSTGPY